MGFHERAYLLLGLILIEFDQLERRDDSKFSKFVLKELEDHVEAFLEEVKKEREKARGYVQKTRNDDTADSDPSGC